MGNNSLEITIPKEVLEALQKETAAGNGCGCGCILGAIVKVDP